jgi:hypothetical protein
MANPPKPHHVPGVPRGEETAQRRGKEPGRHESDDNGYRSARDSTSINAKARDPIDPRMPYLPPA